MQRNIKGVLCIQATYFFLVYLCVCTEYSYNVGLTLVLVMTYEPLYNSPLTDDVPAKHYCSSLRLIKKPNEWDLYKTLFMVLGPYFFF